MPSPKRLGWALVLLGAATSLPYSYSMIYLDDEAALLVLRATAAVVSLVVGAAISGAGMALILGWRTYYEAEEEA